MVSVIATQRDLILLYNLWLATFTSFSQTGLFTGFRSKILWIYQNTYLSSFGPDGALSCYKISLLLATW